MPLDLKKTFKPSLLTTHIQLGLNSKNKDRLFGLGYSGKLRATVLVAAEHLSSGSHQAVTVQCELCGKVSSIVFKDYYNVLEDYSGEYLCKACRAFSTAGHTYEDLYEDFRDCGLFLVPTTIQRHDHTLEYYCKVPGHHTEVQFTTVKAFNSRTYKCKFCMQDSLTDRHGTKYYETWGCPQIRPLTRIFRSKLTSWVTASMRSTYNRCDITGVEAECVHHKYPFHLLIKNAIMHTQKQEKPIDTYNTTDFNELFKVLMEYHTEYLGAPLTKAVHKLFHARHGHEFTEEDYYTFKEDYLSGALL